MNIITLSYKEVKTMIDNDEFDLIIDLRNEDKYNEYHIKNSINIEMNYITDKMEFLNDYKNKKILLYCSIGSKSKSLAKVLVVNGFENLYTLFGGIKEYKLRIK